MYTTVEGLLTAIRDRLLESDPFAARNSGDGATDAHKKTELETFGDRLDLCISGAQAFTLRIEDPMANSWIYR